MLNIFLLTSKKKQGIKTNTDINYFDNPSASAVKSKKSSYGVSKKDVANNKKILVNSGDYMAEIKHFPSANKEWYNSVYTYNKNSIKLLPVADNIIIYMIRAYFNMYSRFLDKKNGLHRTRAWKRILSSRKIWISKPEVKHTNDKVTVNLYIYNRQKQFFIEKIKKLLSYHLYKYMQTTIKTESDLYIEMIKSKSSNLLNLLNLEGKKLKIFETVSKSKLLKRTLKKEIFIMHFMQSLFFNRFKFTSLYIEPLRLILENFYGKKIVFNLVKLKTYFLNSDILTQILTMKTKKKRAGASKVIKHCLVNIKTPVIKKNLLERQETKFIGVQNILIKNFNNINPEQHIKQTDIFDSFINENYPIISRLDTLNSIKNKTVSGVKIQASGRLTRRIIAARAVKKIKSVGIMKDINSSYIGTSSVMLRGNTKSNIQSTTLKSKISIGSFGMKGWVSSM